MIKLVDDQAHVETIKKALKENDGYCPCSPIRTDDTKCMCTAFKNQESGICHCGLYVKTID